MRYGRSSCFGFLWMVLIASPDTVLAQAGAPLGSARAGILDAVSVDTMLLAVPERSATEMQADLVSAAATESSAERAVRLLRVDADGLAASLDEQIEEIERVQDGLRIADELDAATRREALRDELRLRELLRDVTVERIEIANLERAALERRRQHARAWRKQLELEMDLAADRAVWRALHGEDAVVSGAAERRRELASTIDERLQDYFEARRDALREAERLAVAERAVAEGRLEAMSLRRELVED